MLSCAAATRNAANDYAGIGQIFDPCEGIWHIIRNPIEGNYRCFLEEGIVTHHQGNTVRGAPNRVSNNREMIDRVAKDYAKFDGRLKEAAFQVLTKSKNFYVVYSLIDIIKGSTDTDAVSKAMQAVINLIS